MRCGASARRNSPRVRRCEGGILLTIGLTGGMAAGKSTVARRLKELGAHVVDADQLGHRAYAPGTPGFAKVVEAFGEEVLTTDGEVDRRRLAGKVFGNPAELKKLTDIVWPEIRRLADAEIAAGRTANPNGVAVLEAAVMVEAGWRAGLDEIWAVEVEPECAIQRAVARDGLSADAARKRLSAQTSNAERRRHADLVLRNSGSLQHLRTQVDAQWRRITGAVLKPAKTGAR